MKFLRKNGMGNKQKIMQFQHFLLNKPVDAMKYILRLLVVLMMGSAFAQSNLPPCVPSEIFHNCFGTHTFSNGDKYVGEYKDNRENGQGTFTGTNGDKYVGEWKDGKRNGQGTLTFARGEKYVGEFNDGVRQGEGTLYSVNGLIISQGRWRFNRFDPSAPVQQAVAPNQEMTTHFGFKITLNALGMSK